MQIGEGRNYVGVLSKLTGNRAMFVSLKWLCHSIIQASWKQSNTKDEN